MRAVIPSQTGRRVLLGIVVVGFSLALVVQISLGRDGAVSADTNQRVTERLLKLYVPLFGVMGAFYFSEQKRTGARKSGVTSVDALALACFVVGIWAGLPPALLGFEETFERALRMLDEYEVFGSTAAVSALTYYFSRSAEGSGR